MEASFEHWNSRDYLQMLHQLLAVGEALLEQGHDVHHLCLEVPQITFQQAYDLDPLLGGWRREIG